MKKCPEGKYYCNTKKKCMPIPRGHYVSRGGWLRPDPDENGKKKNGNSNGNGNGNGMGHSNGNGNGGSNGSGNGSNGGGMSESKSLSQFKEDSVKIDHIDGGNTTVIDIIKPQSIQNVDIRKVSGWNLATYEAYERDGETFNMIGVYRP